MISLTRLSGLKFSLNADMIESIEGSPETVITLIGGEHIVVRESLRQVTQSIQAYRARALAMSRDTSSEHRPQASPGGRRGNLTPVASIGQER